MFVDKLRVIQRQKKPFRFILSRLLRDLGFLDIFRITYRYRSITLRMTKSALSLSLWVDASDREEDVLFINRVLKENDVVVDVGAHIGHLSLMAAKIVGPLGKVYSIEAHPVTYLDLLENIHLNQADNVYPVNAAAGENFGWLSFSNNVRANDQNKVVDRGPLKVFCVPLDFFLGDLKVALLKIDTEGFEKYVFLGARRVLANTEILIFEAYEQHYNIFDYSFAEVYDFLSSFGFELGLVSGGKVRIIGKDYIPENCVNVVGWKDRKTFIARSGFRLNN